MVDIYKMLQDARPKLRVNNPIVYWISWGFVVFNILIGIYMFTHNDPSFRAIPITGWVDNVIWGSIFCGISMPLAIGLIYNDWFIIRASMITGLFLKAFWAYALIIVGFVIGFLDILASIAMWFMIAFVQAVAVVYFIPKEHVRIKIRNGKST